FFSYASALFVCLPGVRPRTLSGCRPSTVDCWLPNSFRIRTYRRTPRFSRSWPHPLCCNPFRIRTYTTADPKCFRIRTYEKSRGRPVDPLPFARPAQAPECGEGPASTASAHLGPRAATPYRLGRARLQPCRTVGQKTFV